MKQLNKQVKFYRELPLFSDVKEEDLYKLAAKTQIINFTANTLIYRQDDKPTQIYFRHTRKKKIVPKIQDFLDKCSKLDYFFLEF